MLLSKIQNLNKGPSTCSSDFSLKSINRSFIFSSRSCILKMVCKSSSSSPPSDMRLHSGDTARQGEAATASGARK